MKCPPLVEDPGEEKLLDADRIHVVIPKRGEQVVVEQLAFKVLRADSRRMHLLQVVRKKA